LIFLPLFDLVQLKSADSMRRAPAPRSAATTALLAHCRHQCGENKVTLGKKP
jgi:hypothetical protein